MLANCGRWLRSVELWDEIRLRRGRRLSEQRSPSEPAVEGIFFRNSEKKEKGRSL